MEPNEQKELTVKTETDSWIDSRLTAVRWEGVGELGRGVEGLSEREKNKTHGHNSAVIAGARWGEGRLKMV